MITYTIEQGRRLDVDEYVRMVLALQSVEAMCWNGRIPKGPVRVFSAPITGYGDNMCPLNAILPPHVGINRKARRWWWQRGG